MRRLPTACHLPPIKKYFFCTFCTTVCSKITKSETCVCVFAAPDCGTGQHGYLWVSGYRQHMQKTLVSGCSHSQQINSQSDEALYTSQTSTSALALFLERKSWKTQTSREHSHKYSQAQTRKSMRAFALQNLGTKFAFPLPRQYLLSGFHCISHGAVRMNMPVLLQAKAITSSGPCNDP